MSQLYITKMFLAVELLQFEDSTKDFPSISYQLYTHTTNHTQSFAMNIIME